MRRDGLLAGVFAGLTVCVVLATPPSRGEPVTQDQQPPGVVRAGEYAVPGGRAPSPLETASAAGSSAVYDAGPFPLVTPELAPGEGHDVTVAMCSVCHSVRYITMQPPLPAAMWDAEVKKMINVHGAAIPAEAAARISGYLQLNYASR